MSANDKLARSAGLLYLILLPTSGFGMFGAMHLVAAGDPAATLAHIQTSRTLFALAILAGVVGFVDFLIVGLVFNRLFGPVSKGAANLLLAFVAVSVPLSLTALARRIDVLSLVDARLVPLGADTVQTEVMRALQSSDNLMRMSLIFWGLWLFPFGWLMFRSGFAPRVLGLLLMLGGFWYAFIFVGTVLNPAYDSTLFARVTGIISGVPGVIGELGTALWLLVMGARERGSRIRPAAVEVWMSPGAAQR